MPYAFGGMGDETAQKSLMAMVDILNLLLDATADYDPDDPETNLLNKRKCRAIRLQVVETLSIFERDFPQTEMSPFVHEILHVSEFIYRWNNVRNYWCFVTERFVGWMKGLVKNRCLSLQNMVTFIHVTQFDVPTIPSVHSLTTTYAGTQHIYAGILCKF
jgi:hypothetical protein